MATVGIDLGTTNSCVATISPNGKVQIVANDIGKNTTPSVVSFNEKGEIIVGEEAKSQMVMNPRNTVYGIKRLIGYKYQDEDIQPEIKSWPFKVIPGKSGRAAIQVTKGSETKTYSPEEISSFILIKLKSAAEKTLGKEIKNAVITVPAYFNSSQRQATKDAGIIAGLNILGIISEPTAAAIAYGMGTRGMNNKVFVFDFGGGTLDCTLMNVHDGKFDVIATGGNVHFGGEDFDMVLVRYFAEEFRRQTGIDVMNGDKYSRQRANLKIQSEEVKKKLAATGITTASLNIPNFAEGKSLDASITQSKFVYLCEQNDMRDTLDECLNDVFDSASEKLKESIGPDYVDSVIMVGGSSHIPFVIEALNDFFEKRPLFAVDPDTAVAHGAAVYATSVELYKEGGLENAKRPKDENGNFIEWVNPDDLVDVVPLSLGIETSDKAMSVIIPNNTNVPCSQTRTYETAADDQTSMLIQVFEGQREVAAENRKLGVFTVEGLPKRPKGQVKVEITFSIDKENLLKVTCKEKGGSASGAIEIKNDVGHLTPEDIEKMQKEADEYREADRRRIETNQALNDFDSLVITAKRKGNGKDEVKKIAADANRWRDDNDRATADEIRRAIQDFRERFRRYIDI